MSSPFAKNSAEKNQGFTTVKDLFITNQKKKEKQ
jgi:hypothetical protein